MRKVLQPSGPFPSAHMDTRDQCVLILTARKVVRAAVGASGVASAPGVMNMTGPDPDSLEREIKELIVEVLRLRDVTPDQITSDGPLFGDGQGLDSVDALQLVVALDKNYGLKVPDPEAAKTILHSIASMAEAVAKKQKA